jgi:hypothetical protein
MNTERKGRHILRTNFLILALASGGAVFAGLASQTTTYVDGNLNGVTPRSGATLTFEDEKAMQLHTGLSTIAVPYSAVTQAELGAVKTTPHDVPFFKVWERAKHKTETQLLVVNFKNDQGEDQTMTLELARAAAQSVLGEISERSGKNFGGTKSQVASENKKQNPMAIGAPEKTADPWWGDDWWKTERNQDKWSKQPGTSTAPPTSGPNGSQQ